MRLPDSWKKWAAITWLAVIVGIPAILVAWAYPLPVACIVILLLIGQLIHERRVAKRQRESDRELASIELNRVRYEMEIQRKEDKELAQLELAQLERVLREAYEARLGKAPISPHFEALRDFNSVPHFGELRDKENQPQTLD